MPLFDNQFLDRMPGPARSRPRADHPHQPTLDQRFPHVGLLAPDDRRLLDLALKYRVPHRQIGSALNLPAGTVTRRLKRLLARLHDPLVNALADPNCPLSQEYRQLGLEHFLQGQPTARLADLHQMSPLQVRRILEFVRGWHRGFSALSPFRAR
jgi:hypothetical protein